MTSQAATSAAAFGLVGLPNQGSNRMVWPPAVVTSTQEWPYQVIVAVIVGTSAAILSPRPDGPRSRPGRTRSIHSTGASRADRREPCLHQLDGADRPRDRLVR